MWRTQGIQAELHGQVEARVECKPYEANDHHAKMQALLEERKVQIVRDRTQRMQNFLQALDTAEAMQT